MKEPAIVIFAFNRPEALSKLIASLKANPGYEKYPIRVYVDGARTPQEAAKVAEVVAIARQLTPDVLASPVNKGLGPSIIAGVTDVINEYGSAIVLEDDLVLMPGFLAYMTSALALYADDKRVFSICGYGLKIKRPKGYQGDVYLSNRSSSWGWATWKDRWDSVDWEVSDWVELSATKSLQRAFNRGGSDMYGMLRDFMEGRNKSWAIRFCYSQHKQGRYSVHPFESLVANEGYGLEATNCKQKYSRFKVSLKHDLSPLAMPQVLAPDQKIIAASARYHSLPRRIYSRIRRMLNV